LCNTLSVFHPVVKVVYGQAAGSRTLPLRGVKVEIDLRGAELSEFGLTQHKTVSDGGVRRTLSAFDGANNRLSNGAMCTTRGGEGDEEDGPVTIPISLSDGGWQLITPILKNKKAAERGAANMGAAAEVLED
jgi:hypothetical protein